jgi:hypothetical protein
MDDIIYKTAFIIMLVAFPIFYLTISIINVVRYLKSKSEKIKLQMIHRSVSITNTALMIWSLLMIFIYASINYFTENKAYNNLELDAWFFIPLVVTVVLLLFKRIRSAVFAWLFFISCIAIGWAFFITFFKLSLS